MTVKQAFKALPMAARMKAVKNTHKSILRSTSSGDPIYDLGGAFVWSATPQGNKYWLNQTRKLCGIK